MLVKIVTSFCSVAVLLAARGADGARWSMANSPSLFVVLESLRRRWTGRKMLAVASFVQSSRTVPFGSMSTKSRRRRPQIRSGPAGRPAAVARGGIPCALPHCTAIRQEERTNGRTDGRRNERTNRAGRDDLHNNERCWFWCHRCSLKQSASSPRHAANAENENIA